jgi:hypothetical protein
MDKDTRNAIERASQKARKLLEEDFAAQLEGDFDVHRDGEVAAKAGKHLSARDAYRRERIVAAIEHKRAAGMSAADAARDYLRDAAFTTLNRFVALKMLEARELVQECITKGEQSGGYREFCGMAPGLPLLPESAGYRLYIESLFDELSTEVKVLFDRRDPSSVLWPKRATFEQLLEVLNATELARVWGEDETIGWVYQFFNGQDERRKMREESPAPRNSRELAVRNQFFTPRYVVQFLTDNTLGRIWYEMRETKTALAERCEYMVRKPGEEFAPRAKKDPRDLRVLDPACGSGHFLLYAFELLLGIYEEAYADPSVPKSEATGKTLAEDYPSLDALRKAVPGLVLAHNLHGVDIDPRCAQIAQLALWMRAQKAYRDFAIGRGDRAQIRRSNIVVAEPLVADEQIAKEFVANLGDAELGRVFTSLVESLSLAGDLGLLLRVEQLVALQAKRGQTGDLFAPPEERIRAALDRFVREEAGATNTRRRLFADDAAHGVALLTVAEKKFDAVLMNPPFGDACERGRERIEDLLNVAGRDIGAAFVLEAVRRWAPRGYVGVLLPTGSWFKPVFEAWRDEVFWGAHEVEIAAHFGGQVLDGATVNASAVITRPRNQRPAHVLRCTEKRAVQPQLRVAISDLSEDRPSSAVFQVIPREVSVLPGKPFAYWLSPTLRSRISNLPKFEGAGGTVKQGTATADEFRFTRCWWEVSRSSPRWTGFVKSGEFSPLWDECPWVSVRTEVLRSEVDATGKARVQGLNFFGQVGVMFSRKSVIGFNPRFQPAGYGFGDSAPVAFPSKTSAMALLAFLSSRPVEYLVGLFIGELQGQAGVYPLHYQVGVVQRLPWPGIPSEHERKLVASAESAVDALKSLTSLEENSPEFAGLPSFSTLSELVSVLRDREAAALANVIKQRDKADEIVYDLFGFAPVDRRAVCEAMRDMVPPAKGKWRRWFGVEGTDHDDASVARAVLSWLVAVAFGRATAAFKGGASSATVTHPCSVLVDDLGHCDDLGARVEKAISDVGLDSSVVSASLAAASSQSDLRGWLSRYCFDQHVGKFSAGRRKAPIYWQLATASASYSVWLYIHAFSKDTLFRVQNDYVAPKLAHEERRLESLSGELRDGATAAQCKELSAQEAFVEELRAFLDELKRVAPLWKPNLDDGVIINFAPLWRLVPQNKSWQKELKSTWDALCAGKYDWAHLAMHLWPERVVPKCAKDRSLAIAHGLEDVFWVGGADSKWTARKTPTKSADDLVKERTSPAVKSALKILLEAPIASGKSNGRKGGGRRKAAAAAK